MGTRVKVDDRGRITIPNEERTRFGIKDGDEVEILVEEDRLVLIPTRRKVKKVKAGKDWGKDTFLSAGTATFGD